MKQIANIFAFFLILSLITACVQRQSSDSAKYRVLVVHSGDSIGEDGLPYREHMAKKFADAGMDVEVRHYYANLVRTPEKDFLMRFLREFKSDSKYKPDVLILDGDDVTRVMTEDVRGIDSMMRQERANYIKAHPVVLMGVRHMNRQVIDRLQNVTGFRDQIDLQRNAELIQNITGGQNVLLEADRFADDIVMKSELRKQMKDARFVDNSDFHVESLDSAYLAQYYSGKIVVTFVSSAEPETNSAVYYASGADSTTVDETVLMRGSLNTLKDSWFLQVKKDIFSDSFLRRFTQPQFTAIRANFNNPDEVCLLGGYFSSMETQVDDAVSYAVRILNGESPSTLPIVVHESDYYIDYHALEKWTATPLSYGDVAKTFQVINVPYHLSHPVLFWLVVANLVILAVTLIAFLFYFVINHESADERLMKKIMRREKIRRLMLVKSERLIYWFIDDGHIKLQKEFADRYRMPQEMAITEFSKKVMMDSVYSWRMISGYGDEMGPNKVRIHLQLTPEEQHWMEFRFTSTRESKRKRVLMGIAVYCDKEVEKERELDQLRVMANENSLRHSFLSNISQAVRTPLNAVIGFAQLIASDDMDFSKEELDEFCHQVRSNSDEIVKMVDKALDDSLLEIGDVELHPILTSARKFVTDTYEESKSVIPTHLNLRMLCDAEEPMVMMAPAYTHTVLDAFISNAVRFSVTGNIEIGYRVLLEEDKVQFYCKDMGIGISPENCKRVFDRFFKVYDYDKGTGVGLAVAKVIIEKQGGEIGVESREGAGSTFWFKLDRVKN